MNDKHDLDIILAGHFPIIVMRSHEELRALGLLRDIAVQQGRPLMMWSVTDGIRRDKSSSSSASINWEEVTYDGQEATRKEEATNPEVMLEKILSEKNKPIVVLLDFHPYLNNPKVIRRLKEISIGHPQNGISMVLLSHALDLPAELQRLSAGFEMSLPDTEQIKQIIQEEIRIWSMRNDNKPFRGNKSAYQKLARVLTGLTISDVRRLARNAIYDDGAITSSDLPRVMEVKYQLIGQDGLLSFEYETVCFEEVGGFSRLKGWLDLRKSAFLAGADSPLDTPKGMLLLGVQGGGKSLAAKAVAGSWGLPLLRLDFGALYNKYIGETEKNIRQSLQAAEAMSPCVLWIDEIEKGISTEDGDDGTSRRVLGTILTWMAEHGKSIFIVATANDVQLLPPELIRKGRLDEIFFIDLPRARARHKILQIHLEKREVKLSQNDLKELAVVSEGFSGAELEQVVVSSLYAAHGAQIPVTTLIVKSELERTQPLSVVMAEKIADLRHWAAGRTVPAD
ncbi:MAG: AAA family ATPase [Candidatus Thiodiazotropha sp.]|nr:AAA family ATPase [Candidatus Thiodiazotropha sp.]